MSVRFFKRIRILPGVTLNISKRGLSVSLGPRGAKVTANKSGIRKTVGIPGTGLFSTSFKKYKNENIVDNTEQVKSGVNWYIPSLFRYLFIDKANIFVYILLMGIFYKVGLYIDNDGIAAIEWILFIFAFVTVIITVVGLVFPNIVKQSNRGAVIEVGFIYFILFCSALFYVLNR